MTVFPGAARYAAARPLPIPAICLALRGEEGVGYKWRLLGSGRDAFQYLPLLAPVIRMVRFSGMF